MNPHNPTKFEQHPSLHSLGNPQGLHPDPNQDPNLSAFKTSFYDPFDIKTRKRTTRAQFQVLEESFLHDPKPTVQIRRLLAQKLDMSPRTVQIWFQNRRAKQKNKETKDGKVPMGYQPTQGGAQPIDAAFPPKMTKVRHHPQPLDIVNSNYRQVHMPKDMPLWPPHMSNLEPNTLYATAAATHSATVASYHPTPSPTSSHPVYPLTGYDRDTMRRGPVQVSIATDQYATPYSYMSAEHRRNSCPANLLPTFPISVPIDYSNGHTPLPLPSIIEHHPNQVGDASHSGVSEAAEDHSNAVFYSVGGQYH